MTKNTINPYKINTYLIFNEEFDEKELDMIEEYDQEDRLIYKMSRNDGEKIEEYYDYSNGLLIETRVLREGEEIDKEIFRYDEHNRVLERQHFIQGELFEKELNEYGEGGYERILLQDDVVVDRIQMIEKDPLNYSLTIFENEEMLERHEQEFDSNSNQGVLKVFLPDGSQSHEIVFTHDDEGREISKTMYYDEHMLKESTWVYQRDKLLEEIHKDFEEGSNAWKGLYFYDQNGWLERMETRSLSDKLLAYENYKYDREGRLIEKKGRNEGDFSAIYGTYRGYEGYHFKYEYIEIEE